MIMMLSGSTSKKWSFVYHSGLNWNLGFVIFPVEQVFERPYPHMPSCSKFSEVINTQYSMHEASIMSLRLKKIIQ